MNFTNKQKHVLAFCAMVLAAEQKQATKCVGPYAAAAAARDGLVRVNGEFEPA